jgi:Protein of unknown function (DUF2924)
MQVRNLDTFGRVAAVKAEIEHFLSLAPCEIRALWRERFGRSVPRALTNQLLVRMLAWKIQEKAFGGHDNATKRLLDGYGKSGKGPAGEGGLNQRLKTGTVLVRDFNGTRHTVTLVPDGFIWQEKIYSSLSAIAKIITGTNWNGPRFFGLRESPKIRADRKRAA